MDSPYNHSHIPTPSLIPPEGRLSRQALRQTGRSSPTRNGDYKYQPRHHHTRFYRNWDKQVVQVNRCPHIKIARWITNLLPPLECTPILQAAAIVGSRYSGTQVRLPQFYFKSPHTPLWGTPASPYTFHCSFQPEHIYQRLWDFGDEACLTSWCTIVRTAISIGLELPGAFDGITIPTRTKPFEEKEWIPLLIEANVRPLHPLLISSELRTSLTV